MPNGPNNVDLTIDANGNYRFTGGNDGGNGNCKNPHGEGAAPVLITLNAPAGYSIRAMTDDPPGIQLSGTGVDQMAGHVAGNGQSANISNTCVALADVDYTVNVDRPQGPYIACHPKIVNT